MPNDAAALMGAPEDLASTIGTQAPEAGSPSTPQEAVKGVIELVSRYQRNLSDIRQGAQTLQTQFPANGKTMEQIADLTDQLQKLLASYMTDVVKQTAPATDAGSSLSSVLR